MTPEERMNLLGNDQEIGNMDAKNFEPVSDVLKRQEGT